MNKRSSQSKDTERRRSARRLDDLFHPDFQDMTDNAVQGILIHSNFKPLYANEALARLFGYDKPEDITSMPLIRSLYPKDKWAEVEQSYDAFTHSSSPKQIGRMQAVTREGKEIWLSTTKRLIDWHGTQAVQLCAFDISEQVKMEQQLLENDQQLRAILEILPVPVFITRREDGRILFVNRKICLLLQQSAGPLLRSSSKEYFVNPEDRDKIQDMIDTVHDLREIEVRMKTAQGHEFLAELAVIKMVYGGEPSILVSLNDISARKKLENELFHQANTDALTGLSNRRFFLDQAEQEIRRARRFTRPLSLIMMDLDHFKHVNDTYGHAAGDAALETIVGASMESLRESDIMGRLGGEEFAILLPETSLQAAHEVAGRLLTHVAKTPVNTGKKNILCTASLGVTELKTTDNSVDELLSRADEALFHAKDSGRNCIKLAK